MSSDTESDESSEVRWLTDVEDERERARVEWESYLSHWYPEEVVALVRGYFDEILLCKDQDVVLQTWGNGGRCGASLFRGHDDRYSIPDHLYPLDPVWIHWTCLVIFCKNFFYSNLSFLERSASIIYSQFSILQKKE